MIVAINDNEHSVRWRENQDGTISGTLNDFHFKISGYNFEENKMRRIPIRCPFCLVIEN